MSENTNGLLSGLTVIELGSVLACPAVGMFMAELGARVIKIENITTRGDVTRSWKLPSELAENDISAYFSCVNWGKESLVIDLSQPDGQKILHDLIAYTDIVLVNYKAGDAKKLKADYDTLRTIKQNLIYGHITGYGLDDPRTGYDAVIQAESGFTFINGEPDGGPIKLPVAFMDLLAAHQLKEGLLLALLKRERTGQGEYVAVSLLQAGIASLVNQASNWLVGNTIPTRMGSDHPNIAPYGTIFRTADDKLIVLAVGSDRQFAKLCMQLGQAELAEDRRFSNNQHRVQNRQELNNILGKLIGKQERQILLDAMERDHVPAGAVNNMAEVFSCPQAEALIVKNQLDKNAEIRAVHSVVFHFQQQEAVQKKLAAPPRFGQHSRSLMADTLGYSPEQIDTLIQSRVLFCPG